MTMPIIHHPRIHDRPVLVGDRVRLRADDHIPDPLMVAEVRYSDLDGNVWLDLTDGVYTVACTVEELEGFVDG